MTVRVEACWGGGKSYSWRLEFWRNGRKHREGINCAEGASWDRKAASLAKDFISQDYKIPRRNIRFYVV